ncbi:hypothetical protein RHSIM_Rhsim02G0209900 [Rhododendron simsii]|uniref:Uncharacterized protein n=1 Tax=Rhododendron simsii TaxID=118357 RepID=A0A834HB93_RHOSS|nr:hypothetical protein RHSIM_Rhsim02G0209900 [Rhododendron simsii]
MWKLKVAEGLGPCLYSTNNFVDRQIWELNPDVGTSEEREAFEKARDDYQKNKSRVRLGGDVLMRLQVVLTISWGGGRGRLAARSPTDLFLGMIIMGLTACCRRVILLVVTLGDCNSVVFECYSVLGGVEVAVNNGEWIC